MNPIETSPLGARPELFSQRSIADHVYQGYNSTLNNDTSLDELDQFFSFEVCTGDLSENFNLQLADGNGSSLSQPRAPEPLEKTTQEINIQDLLCITTNQEASKPKAASIRWHEPGIIYLLSCRFRLPLWPIIRVC